MTHQQVRTAAAGERGGSAATSPSRPGPNPAAPTFEFAGSRFTAGIYDAFLAFGEHRGMRATRRGLLSGARGRVLEIGAGTGLNLDHYPDAIDELVLVEPSAPMADRLEARRAKLARRADIVAAPAEALPFAEDSFDTVVSTLVLCTVHDPDAALAEVRRVLRPGGRLLFCEHIRSDSPRLSRWQDRLADAWAAVADGCRCNRETLETISSQMRITTVDHLIWHGMPHLVHPVVVGEAVV